MARKALSQEEFEAIQTLSKAELLCFIREKFLARSKGRPKSGNPLSGSERVKRHRDRKLYERGFTEDDFVKRIGRDGKKYRVLKRY